VNTLKKIGIAVATLALGAASQAATSSPWACATIQGFGLDTTVGYGYQDCSIGQTRTAQVQSADFRAAWGGDGSSMPPDAPYPIVYSGMASSDPAAGVLRAAIGARELEAVPFRWGEADASLYGLVRLGDSGSGALSKTLAVNLDGWIRGWGQYDMNIELVRLRDEHVFHARAADSPPEPLVDDLAVDTELQLTIDGEGGDWFGLFVSLHVSAPSNCWPDGCSADFSHTATLSFSTGGAAVYSQDGFLADVPGVVALPGGTVPEPGTIALVLAATAVALRRSTPRLLRSALPLGAALLLSGCFDPMNPIAFREEPITLAVKGGEFKALRAGCTINRGEFTDRAGQMRSAAAFKFIAVSPEGRTIGEWLASCQAVAPNGTSDCKVATTGAGNMLNSGGLSCPAFKNLQLVSGSLF
jgi:hypothetical protein